MIKMEKNYGFILFKYLEKIKKIQAKIMVLFFSSPSGAKQLL